MTRPRRFTADELRSTLAGRKVSGSAMRDYCPGDFRRRAPHVMSGKLPCIAGIVAEECARCWEPYAPKPREE